MLKVKIISGLITGGIIVISLLVIWSAISPDEPTESHKKIGYTSYEAIELSRQTLQSHLGVTLEFPFAAVKTENVNDSTWMVGGKFKYQGQEKEYFCFVNYYPSTNQVSCTGIKVGDQIFKPGT